jgi:hypothetical protein
LIERRRLVAAPTTVDPGRHQVLPQTVRLSQAARSARRLRRPHELLEAIAALDTVADESVRAQILDWIQQSYEDRGGGILLGLFGKCYLGSPYVDHRMSLDGSILEHFKGDENVPPAFEPCRALVRSSAYAYIEVYADGQVVPIRTDGSSAI